MNAGREGEGHEGEGQPDTRPYFCIPYWTNPLTPGGHWDTGQKRPVPGGVVFYMCESIHASDYTPGEELRVTVDIRNSGGGNSAAIATVVVYWADPTAGFAKPHFFGATTVAVMPDVLTPATATTPTLTATIPVTAPQHICLLAIVSHPQDKAGTTYDPIGDRHWAQRNLIAVAAAKGAPALVPFNLANPFPTEADLTLLIAPADERRAAIVARTLGLEAAYPQTRLRLLDEKGSEIGEPGEQVIQHFALDGRAQLQLQVLVELADDITPGTAGTLEALVLDSQQEKDHIVGALGITLLASD